MNKKIIDISHKPESNNKLFFGDYGQFIRIDKIQYAVIKNLYENSEGNTWFPSEINYDNDAIGFETLPKEAKRMFRLNIAYQTLLDSGVTNIFSELSKVATVPELQYLYRRISIEESIHSLTYSNGLDVVFGEKAEEMLDLVYSDPFIKKRLDNELDGAERFLELCIEKGETGDDAKKSILMLLGLAFILEGIKFPFSFFVTWTINKSFENQIQGFTKALRLIAWDELTVHTTAGVQVLKILMSDENQGFKHLKNWFHKEMVSFVKLTVEQELEWSEYLLKDGNIAGFNKDIGSHFIKYWADFRLEQLNIPIIYNEKKSDVIDWFNSYRNLNGTQVALQESSAMNYQKGKLNNDLNLFDGKIL